MGRADGAMTDSTRKMSLEKMTLARNLVRRHPRLPALAAQDNDRLCVGWEREAVGIQPTGRDVSCRAMMAVETVTVVRMFSV